MQSLVDMVAGIKITAQDAAEVIADELSDYFSPL
jgi:hypothetical protein